MQLFQLLQTAPAADINIPLGSIITQYGMAGAVLVVVYFFLSYMQKNSTATTEALTKMAVAIDKLADRVDALTKEHDGK
jgi:hypothetical protein